MTHTFDISHPRKGSVLCDMIIILRAVRERRWPRPPGYMGIQEIYYENAEGAPEDPRKRARANASLE